MLIAAFSMPSPFLLSLSCLMVRQELLSAVELTRGFVLDQAAGRSEQSAADISLQESRRQLRATAGALSSVLEANVSLRAALRREHAHPSFVTGCWRDEAQQSAALAGRLASIDVERAGLLRLLQVEPQASVAAQADVSRLRAQHRDAELAVISQQFPVG